MALADRELGSNSIAITHSDPVAGRSTRRLDPPESAARARPETDADRSSRVAAVGHGDPPLLRVSPASSAAGPVHVALRSAPPVNRPRDWNKTKIVDAGALEPLLGYLQSSDLNLQEYATAAVLTLSASSTNKPIISSSGAIPLLVKVLKEGNPQAKNDAVMALYNLSTITDNLQAILAVQPIPPLIELLKGGKRSSKTADKCCALLESLLAFDQCRVALTSEEGGVLTIVEVLEEGSLQGREHAVGALLTMCESDRSKYRDLILNEGAIPGLLELTVHGTPKSRMKAHVLLDLLRNSPYSRSKLQPDTLENIVTNIASQIDGEDRGGKAKKMLAEMVKVSMEQSLRHLQRRASFA
ncbi:hypothetical protein SETIT_5G076100v2 [Setaria italica]|uniref:U-box domain-containing protein n=1 Tax=Setaria italica TaxID=4555 RepID=A0A368R452_SETIT|nr:hypothetical protein SETIT_5G076100v2 [Setaria italica]